MRTPTSGEWLAVYALGFVLTFGFSFNHDYDVPTNNWEKSDNAFRALCSALVWPAYLSKVAFEGARP